jgi:hypothetical protein
MKNITLVFALGAVLLGMVPLVAQQAAKPHKRVSPHETISMIVDGDFFKGNRVMIVYGRPYINDPKTGAVRKIWGGLVPFGQVWRTGADEATLLLVQQPIEIGSANVPAGVYTLWTLPKEDGTAELIINKQVGQWGVGPGSYDERQDLARAELTKENLAAPVNQFTIMVLKNPSGSGGTFRMEWENTGFSVPITIPK